MLLYILKFLVNGSLFKFSCKIGKLLGMNHGRPVYGLKDGGLLFGEL
jgi:hypothetical protein